jgi:hypothetical protein
VPSCAFDIAFVKGAVIEKLGPAGSDNFYSPQGRLIDGDSGDEGVKVCLDPVDLGDDSKIQSATMMDTLGEAEENKPEEKIEEKVEVVADEKMEEKSDESVDSDSTTKEEVIPSNAIQPPASSDVSEPVVQNPTPIDQSTEPVPASMAE